jgi:hypothetical protein
MSGPDAIARTPPSLPGDCVPIPQARAEIRDERGRVAWVVETHVVEGLDLDGHGSPVVLVPPERDNLNVFGMWWRLFIQRGACGHELGVIVGMGEPELEVGESHGLRNFSVITTTSFGTDEAAMQGIGSTTYEFNGQRYVGGQTDYR